MNYFYSNVKLALSTLKKKKKKVQLIVQSGELPKRRLSQ